MGFGIVVIGVSLGGFKAMQVLLRSLPSHFPVPVAVVQHRDARTDSPLCELLQIHSLLPVVEVSDKLPIRGHCVYIAPPDYHMLVDRGHFALSTEGPVSHARPSIDVLFDSAAFCFGSSAVGVILTGLNNDGAQGLAELKRRGGVALVQSPGESERSSMPQAAIDAALNGKSVRPGEGVMRLSDIGGHLMKLCCSESLARTP